MTPSETASTARQRITDDAAQFAESFRREHPVQWWLTLVGPPAATALLLLLLLLIHGGEFVQHVLVRAVAAFFLFGKFAILEPQSALSSEALFTLVLYMDLSVAVFVSFHIHFLFGLPVLGEKLQTLAKDGAFVMQAQPWMRRMTFVGLVAFVMFPLAATGSIGGAIFGRLIGLRRRTTFIGVTLGSVLGCSLMYFGAELVRTYLDQNGPMVKYGGVAAVAAILWWLNRRYQAAKQRAGF